MARVRCRVEECTYWGRGNVCEADAIEVATNRRDVNMEVGTIGAPGQANRATNSRQTQCTTFRPRAGLGRR